MTGDYDAVIIGGGAVGCSVARWAREHGGRVLLLEREDGLLQRASYANQARVHNGYHYPRSFLTALRSRVNFPRFVDEYSDCIERGFAKYYAVARNYSKVTSEQFATFCRRIGAPIAPAPSEVHRLFNPALIEDVFLVEEFAFDARRLAARMLASLEALGVELEFGADVERLAPEPDGTVALRYRAGGEERQVRARRAFNCTYSQINRVLHASGLPLIPLKHELTEMALVQVPPELEQVGVTVMCGPFFSLMPFPPRGLHTLSHVRYTPHGWWDDRGGPLGRSLADLRASRESNYPRMIRDAQRYLPMLRHSRYVDSLWEVKTVLPSSEADDSRPILFRRDDTMPSLTSIMGGKIDNIYDVLEELEEERASVVPA